MSENQGTGLCAFDSHQVDVNTLRHLATLHPLSTAECPEPQFRLFVDDRALWLEGEVNAFAVGEAKLALQHLPPTTGVAVDLTNTEIVTKAAFSALRRLCETGVTDARRGATDVARSHVEEVGMPTEHFYWVEA